MTEAQAHQLIAEVAADFIANPYNLQRDLLANHEGDEQFAQAVELLGGESNFTNELGWKVVATAGEAVAEA